MVPRESCPLCWQRWPFLERRALHFRQLVRYQLFKRSVCHWVYNFCYFTWSCFIQLLRMVHYKITIVNVGIYALMRKKLYIYLRATFSIDCRLLYAAYKKYYQWDFVKTLSFIINSFLHKVSELLPWNLIWALTKNGISLSRIFYLKENLWSVSIYSCFNLTAGLYVLRPTDENGNWI